MLVYVVRARARIYQKVERNMLYVYYLIFSFPASPSPPREGGTWQSSGESTDNIQLVCYMLRNLHTHVIPQNSVTHPRSETPDTQVIQVYGHRSPRPPVLADWVCSWLVWRIWKRPAEHFPLLLYSLYNIFVF